MLLFFLRIFINIFAIHSLSKFEIQTTKRQTSSELKSTRVLVQILQ